jgi:cytochrome c2
MFTRDEQNTFPLSWLVIGGLFAGSAVWAYYNDAVTRLPWVEHQKAFFALELELAKQACCAERARWRQATTKPDKPEDDSAERAKLRADLDKLAEMRAEIGGEDDPEPDCGQKRSGSAEPVCPGIEARAAEPAPVARESKYRTAKALLDDLDRQFLEAEREKTFGASDLDETYYYRNLAEYERDKAQVAVRARFKEAYADDPARARREADQIYRDPPPPPEDAAVSKAIQHLRTEQARMRAHREGLAAALKAGHPPELGRALEASRAAEQAVLDQLALEEKHQTRIDAAVARMAALDGPVEPPVVEKDPSKAAALRGQARRQACDKAGFPAELGPAAPGINRNCLRWLVLEPKEQELKQALGAVSKVMRPLVDADQRLAKAEDRAKPKLDLGLNKLIPSLVGPYEIKQIVTRWIDFKREVDIEQVDRCQTCHVGADSRQYADPSIAAREFRTHPRLELLMGAHPIDAFGCTVCHQGQGRATDDLAHSGWRLGEKFGRERWHFEGDHYWEDPLLQVGKLSHIVVDDENDELVVKLGRDKESRIKLAPGKHASEASWLGALQTELGAVVAASTGLGEGWRAVARKLDNRISIGIERTAEAEPGKGKKPPRVTISFPDRELATMLGFRGVRQLDSKTRTLFTAPEPPWQPVRTETRAASGTRVDQARFEAAAVSEADYRFVPPDGSAGLQIPDDQRNHFIQALPEVESGCLRCHGRDADLRPRRSQAKHVQAKLAYEKAEAERARDPVGYQERRGTDALPSVPEAPNEVTSLAPTLERGRSVFRQLNCTGCHVLEGFDANRNAGPQLNDVTAKLSPKWLLAWLRDPRGWRPKTSMPNLWPRPVDPASKLPYAEGSPEHERWKSERAEETVAVAAFLFERAESAPAGGKPLRARVAGYANVEGASAELGKKVFEAYGCQGCHAVVDGGPSLPQAWRERERDLAPTLANIGQKTHVDWLAYWVEEPGRYWHGTSMPRLRLSRKEAASVARYLASLQSEPPDAARAKAALPSDDEVALVADADKRRERAPCAVAGGMPLSRADCGERVIAQRGCFGCHQIRGFEKEAAIGPELTGFAQKDVTTLDFGYAESDHHLQTTETFATLKLDSPRIFERDRITLRMGDFDLSADEIRSLVVMLKGLVNQTPSERFDPLKQPRYAGAVEGRQLVEDLNCRGCHVIDGRGADIDGWRKDLLASSAGVQMRAPWLDGEGARVQPEWLFDFLRAPGEHGIRPWLHPEWAWRGGGEGEEVPEDKLALRMPSFDLSAEQWTAIVRYFAVVDEQPYPYHPPEVPVLSKDERLYAVTHMTAADDANCLKCHFHGDFPIEKGKKELADMAPNFDIVRRRLRPEWVRLWLLRPQSFLPYTKMTAFWATAFRPEDAGRWPGEQDPFLSSALAWKKVPAPGEQTVESQIAIVRDLLFGLPDGAAWPAAGQEASSPIVDPEAARQAAEAEKTEETKAGRPRRTGAARTPTRL